MRTKLVTLVLAGTLGLTGAALLVPGSALAQTADGTPRLTALKDALTGLVGDGTLTQSQADKVATTIDGALPGRGQDGPGGREGGHRHGGAGHLGPQEIAKVLGITAEELHTQREAGKTLTQIAATKGISKDSLISQLVSAAKARLATAVTDGKLTQAKSDTVAAGLQARITDQVDRVGPGRPGRDRDGDAPNGDGPNGGGPNGGAPATRSAAPSPSSATGS
ncbi:MAG: hypothetical protein H7323_16840 [Frankiales bacterium]|nr:hypothetical protein [Frankiales bacterium]